MKNISSAILIALFIVATSNNCIAQWVPVYQDINTLFGDAAFPTDHTGYVTIQDTIGIGVLCTNDGGISWNKKYITGLSGISRVAMADSMTGYLIQGGVPIKLLKTTDGFSTYTIHRLDSCYAVLSLELLNDSTGFYLNNETRLRKFKHSGTSFFHVFDTLFAGQNLQFVNSHTGFLDNGDRLLMTSDTGATWNYVNNNLGFYCVVFEFADSLNGYFHDGVSTIYKTSDGGVTFPIQYNFPGVSGFAAVGNFCMASNNMGNVAYTTDGGLTWQTESTGINFTSPDSYVIKNTPGGNYFLYSGSCGEIRKRSPLISGISETSVDENISIFPNPFSQQTTISFGEQNQNWRVKIVDVLGKGKMSLTFTGNQLVIDRSELSEGVYFVMMTDEKNNVTNRKIIVQ